MLPNDTVTSPLGPGPVWRGGSSDLRVTVTQLEPSVAKPCLPSE